MVTMKKCVAACLVAELERVLPLTDEIKRQAVNNTEGDALDSSIFLLAAEMDLYSLRGNQTRDACDERAGTNELAP